MITNEEGITVEHMKKITPDMARQILAGNTNNRSVRSGHVKAMARDMMQGRWREDLCPPIILGRDGVLIDGQHRLMALIIAGITILFDVRMVHDESCRALPIDVGIVRGPGDLLLRPAKVSQVVNTIATIHAGRAKATRDELEAWDPVIGDVAHRLVSKNGGDVRSMTTAPIRAGFCLSALTVARDDGEDFVFSIYSDLKAARLEMSLLSSVGAMYRRLLSARDGGGTTGATIRCWIVVEAFRRRNASVIRCPDNATMTEDLRGLLAPLLPAR